MNGPEPMVSVARRWVIIGVLFAAACINYLDRAILSFALPAIALELHLQPIAKGVLLSAFFWSYSLMQVPMGWLCDRYDIRWLYAGAFALFSLACGLTGFATSLGMLIALRVILGVGESVYLPGSMKVVSFFFDAKNRGLASGVVDAGIWAGLALGSPLLATLIVSFGWRSTFFVVGLASSVWLAPWLALYPARSINYSSKSTSTGRLPGGIDCNLLALFCANFCYGYYWCFLVTWLPDYLVVARHMSLRSAGIYAAIPYLIFGLSEPLGGWIADRLVRFGWSEMRSRKVVIGIAFLSGLTLLPVGFGSSDVGTILLIGGAALVGMATANILALLQRLAPSDGLGLWTGFMNLGGNLSGIIAPIMTGFLIARTHSYYPGFVAAVVVLLLGLPFFGKWILTDSRFSERLELPSVSQTQSS